MDELKVNLVPVLKKLSVYTKGSSISSLTGGYRSIFKGRGLEFDHYREYNVMDDAHFIDWKASLKVQEPLVKVFSEERNIDVFFLFDVSESMLFGSTEKLKCEYAIELISSLSYAVLQAEDNIGLAMFNDKIVKITPPSHGNQQYYRIKKLLTNPDLYGGKFDLNQAIRFVGSYQRRGGILIIISDFIGLGESWDRFLKISSRKFDVIGMMIRDPRDDELPKYVGEVAIEDPYSNQRLIIDTTKDAKNYKEYNEKKRDEIRKAFNNMGADLLEIKTDAPFTQQVMGFFENRERRLR